MSRFNTIVVENPITNVVEVLTPGPPGRPVHGGVFITDIVAQSSGENVGNKIYTDDEVGLLSCVSTSNFVTVHIKAITGHTSFRPRITVNEIPVTITELPDKPLFTGSVSLEIPSNQRIEANHSDGASWVSVVEMDAAPVVLSAVFFGDYPGVQTELKENDQFSIRVDTDIPIVAYEVSEYGALKYKTGSLGTPETSFETTGTIANRGTTAQLLGYRVRVQSETGAWSQWYDSDSIGITDGLSVLNLNNQKPVLSFSTINYPIGQMALKDSEEAAVHNSASHYDTLTYSSSYLGIENPTILESPKIVSRVSGNYVLGNTLLLSAHRVANDSNSTATASVKIAHTAPQISTSLPYARLRSGGSFGTSAQSYTLTVSSDQQLMSAPSISAPSGILSGSWSGSGTTWHTTIDIHDDDTKGVFAWGDLVVTNLSGKVVNSLSSGLNYEIGGFVMRTFYVPEYPNRQAFIGTKVVDTAKLRCTNLSKGPSGSHNFTYQATTTESVDKYTILTDDTWYNCDGLNASANTAGTMQVELEEIV